MRIPDDVLSCLASEQRDIFLAELTYELSVSARASYVEAGNTPDAASRELRCHNELLHVATSQLRASLGATPGYPDNAFVEALISKAKLFGGCERELHWMLERACQQVSVRS